MGGKSDQTTFKITGTIEQRRGLLHMQLSAGIDENGKRNRKSIATGLKAKGNKRNADDLMNDVINKLVTFHQLTGVRSLASLVEFYERGDTFELIAGAAQPEKEAPKKPEEGHLFSQIMKDYLRYSKTRVDENTYEKYRYASKHIIPYFESRNIYINKLSPKDVIDYYADMMDEDLAAENDTTALGAATMAAHHTVINQTMDYAKRVIKIIEWNPVSDVHAPKRYRRVPSFYNKLQINEVFRKIKGHVMEPIVILTATYGLRRGEVLGLKWSAIDFEDKSVGKFGSLVIRHTVKKAGKKIVRADRTKSTASLRTLPLTENIAKYLKRLYAHQKQMQALCKVSYYASDYVCKWNDGHEIRPDYVSETWKSLLEKYNMPHIRFHDLRHSCASLLIKMKFSLKEVQEWLGHADIKSTEIYVHLYNSKEDVAIEMDKVLEFDTEFDLNLDMAPNDDEMAM